MVSCTDCNTVSVENTADIMRMNSVNCKADNSTMLFRLVASLNIDVRNFHKSVKGSFGKLFFNTADCIKTNILNVFNCSFQPPCASRIYRSCLEFMR